MNVVWDEGAWDDYTWWHVQYRKTVKRINALIKDIDRRGNDEGIGKPESLKYGFHGYWSLTYRVRPSWGRTYGVDRSGDP